MRTVVPNETQIALDSQTVLDFSVDYLRSSLADHIEFHDVGDPSDLLARVEGRRDGWQLRDFAVEPDAKPADDSSSSTS